MTDTVTPKGYLGHIKFGQVPTMTVDSINIIWYQVGTKPAPNIERSEEFAECINARFIKRYELIDY